MVRYKKKHPTKSPRAAVTAAPPSADDRSLGSVSRSTCSQQRLQNDDTASLSASTRTVAVAIADSDISKKSNEDDTDKEEDNEEEDKDVGKGEDLDNEGSKEDDRNKTEGEAQANRFESISGPKFDLPTKLEEVLRDAGHDFEICTKTSDQVKKRLLEVVLQEKSLSH